MTTLLLTILFAVAIVWGINAFLKSNFLANLICMIQVAGKFLFNLGIVVLLAYVIVTWLLY